MCAEGQEEGGQEPLRGMQRGDEKRAEAEVVRLPREWQGRCPPPAVEMRDLPYVIVMREVDGMTRVCGNIKTMEAVGLLECGKALLIQYIADVEEADDGEDAG